MYRRVEGNGYPFLNPFTAVPGLCTHLSQVVAHQVEEFLVGRAVSTDDVLEPVYVDEGHWRVDTRDSRHSARQ